MVNCTCEICPKRISRLNWLTEIFTHNWCSYYEAEIIAPAKTWCRLGVVAIWMATSEPEKVAEFLSLCVIEERIE